ncbi:MAG: serine hydrolase [Bacteroidota bacterium]
MKSSLFCLFFLIGVFGFSQTYFPPADGGNWETISYVELGWCQESIDTLLTFLDANNTKAFMILKEGRIVLEEYFDGHNENTLWYWASAGKTLTATLVGKALEDDLLELEDPVSQYIGAGWTSCDPVAENERTIFHQLTMTSSFNSNPFLWDCTEPGCYQCTGQAPGTEWHYHNGVYRRLIEVVESATGISRNGYTNQVIEEITGMTGFWADNLYFSVHRDMARYGWLALNDFVWDGTAVLNDSEYIEDLTTPSQNLNPSYGYLWWLNGQSGHKFPLDPNLYAGSMIPSGPDDMYMALGADDQKIYVVPSQSLVVTRQGDAASEMTLAGSTFDEELWSLISQLECDPLTTKNQEDEDFFIFSNPLSGAFTIPVLRDLKLVNFYRTNGQHVLTGVPSQLVQLEKGIYISEAKFNNGRSLTQKLIVQ